MSTSAVDPNTGLGQPSAWARKITTDSLAGKPLPACLLMPEIDPDGPMARLVQTELTASRLGHACRVHQAGGYSPAEPKIG